MRWNMVGRVAVFGDRYSVIGGAWSWGSDVAEGVSLWRVLEGWLLVDGGLGAWGGELGAGGVT